MSVTPESLFREWFLPLYPEDAKSDLGRARSMDANPANNLTVLAHLDDAAAVFASNAAVALGLPSEQLALDYSDASVHRIDPSDIELIATQPIDITSVMAAQMKAAENPSV